MKAKLELKEIPGKGEGVFATESFQKGDFILKCEIREDNSKNHAHASQVGIDKWMSYKGLGIMINHSCDPNCGIQCDEDEIRKYIAFKDIEAGQELTFDYAMGNYQVEYFP